MPWTRLLLMPSDLLLELRFAWAMRAARRRPTAEAFIAAMHIKCRRRPEVTALLDAHRLRIARMFPNSRRPQWN